MTLQWKTKLAESYGGPEAWGVVLRTIKGSSEGFTCITTFGRWIAAACDGAVEIYDSVTGVLRLSLSPPDPVQAMKGSPDGSILFCIHQPPSITLWDIQTGGLTHTLLPGFMVEDIAISPMGCYLAYVVSDSSLKIWDITNRQEGFTTRFGYPSCHLCWLKPEEQLAVAYGGPVKIMNVVSGEILRQFTIRIGIIRGVVYSQKFDELAIVTTFMSESTLTLIRLQTGSTSIHKAQVPLSSLGFSQTTKDVVCCTHTGALELFDTSTQSWRQLDNPAEITSIYTLSSGTLAVNTTDSFIQLLSPENGNTRIQQPTAPTLAVRTLDRGNILDTSTMGGNHALLLEPDTMSNLFTIATGGAWHSTTILCASHRNGVVVCYSNLNLANPLELWRFHGEFPVWTAAISGKPSLTGISPAGSKIVTLHPVRYSTHISVWCMQTGIVQAQSTVNFTCPLDLTFDSETEFNIHNDTYCIPCKLTPLSGSTLSHQLQIFEGCRELPRTQTQELHVDESYEWVVDGLKKICWIPPGYIKSGDATHCWTKRELVMVGQHGELRKLKFCS